MDIAVIAAKVGRSQAYVKERLSLLKAVPNVADKLKKGPAKSSLMKVQGELAGHAGSLFKILPKFSIEIIALSVILLGNR